MKKALTLIPLIALLAACGTTKDAYERRADDIRERQEKAVKTSLDQAPKWMFETPISGNAVYASGTAPARDFSMSLHKAKADAYGKICMTAGGTASQKTKIYKADTANTSGELSEMAMRMSCKEVDLTGVEVKDKKIVQEGNRYRAYVLVALPTGDANVLKRAKENAKLQDQLAKRAPDAYKELDN